MFAHKIGGHCCQQTDRKISVRWEEGEDVFTVITIRLENLCKDCVHAVGFMHQRGRPQSAPSVLSLMKWVEENQTI